MTLAATGMLLTTRTDTGRFLGRLCQLSRARATNVSHVTGYELDASDGDVER